MKKNFDIDYSNIKFIDMINEKPKYFKNDSKYDNSDIVYVTAFLNINRDNWNNYSRTMNSYVDAFMFYLINNINIIAFIDEDIYNNPVYNQYFKNYIHNIRLQGNMKTKIIPINREWLYNHSLCWKKNELQKNIMNTFYYKSLVLDRIKKGCPENIYPEYNTVNHSKIDFIKYIIDNKYVDENDILCWTDFGIHMTIYNGDTVNYPYLDLDKNKLNLDKINICIMNKVNEFVSNPINMLIHSPEIFSGGFFIGTIECMNHLYQFYHEALDELYDNNIADDDQHIYLRCYLTHPEYFELYKSNNYFGHNPALILWPRGLEYFQKNTIHIIDIISNYIDKNKNGIFVEIGVYKGFMANYILSTYSNFKYYGIDPYEQYDNYEESLKKYCNEELYIETKNTLENKYGDRINLIKKYSHKAMDDIENEVDLIYIDANHKYDYVYQDLCNWYEKCKVGGLICLSKASDIVALHHLRDNENNVYIQWNENDYGKYGVIQACKTFCSEKKIAYYICREHIFIKKPLYYILIK